MVSDTKHTWIFRTIIKKYPKNKPLDILEDLVAGTPGFDGTWFAAVKSARRCDEAIDLAHRTPCEPRTITRSARSVLSSVRSAVVALDKARNVAKLTSTF